MKMHRMAAVAAVLTLSLTGCGSKSGSKSEPSAAPSATESATTSATPSSEPTASASASASPSATFSASSSVGKLMSKDKITIGIKFDQPGIGYKDAATGEYSGFDVEIAQLIADKLGIAAKNITFKEAVSANREVFLKQGTVDLVVASYSITDKRRAEVGQAGPYYETGQQLLVRTEDKDTIAGPDDIKDKKVCSVKGSTSIKTVEAKYGAKPAPFDTYSECVTQLLNKTVDAVTTDGAILLGYAAKNPDKLTVVGDAFSQERYGIGFKKDDSDMCRFLRETMQAAFDDGGWQKAYDDTLGKSGSSAPNAPKLDAGC